MTYYWVVPFIAMLIVGFLGMSGYWNERRKDGVAFIWFYSLLAITLAAMFIR